MSTKWLHVGALTPRAYLKRVIAGNIPDEYSLAEWWIGSTDGLADQLCSDCRGDAPSLQQLGWDYADSGDGFGYYHLKSAGSLLTQSYAEESRT